MNTTTTPLYRILQTASTELSTDRTEVFFIMDNIAGWQTLAADVPEGTTVIILDSGTDGLAQMAEYLEGRDGIDAIHIISHGDSGSLDLGAVSLTSENFNDYSEMLSRIGASLSEDGDILLYGCNVANGQTGIEFVGKLARATDADVAASSDLTGATFLGGDWILETSVGAVEQNPLIFSDYTGTLAAPDLVNALGGAADFGENAHTRNDDTPTGAIDITSVFGESGLKFGDTYYTSMYINNNGMITFGSAFGGYTPNGLSEGVNGGIPAIALYWTDLDTRYGTVTASDGGTSTGTNLVYWDIDTVNKKITITWDDVGEFSNGSTTKLAGQIILYYAGDGDMNIEFRYEYVAVLDSHTVTAGWNVGTTSGTAGIDYYEIPVDSGGGSYGALADLDTRVGNTGIDGIWRWYLRDGVVKDTAGTLSYSLTTLTESTANDGSIATTITITLDGDVFTGSNGDNFVGTGVATVANVPAGLTAVVTRTSDTTATLTLTGNAASHANANDISNLTVTFLDGAFDGNNATSIQGASGTSLYVDFIDEAGNTAPTGVGDLTLAAVNEDTAAPAGASINALTGFNFQDSDPGDSLGGVAVISNTADAGTQGAWQYSTDAGAHWSDIGTVSNTQALALSADTLVRFVPVADYNGTPPALVVRAMDDSANFFSSTGATESRATLDASLNGGGTAIAAATNTISTGITAVNDTPTLSVPASIAVTEDVASALTGISFADIDAGSGNVTATLSVASGTLAATTGSGVTAAGSGTASLTLTGTITDINAFIAASKVTFTTATDATSNVTLTVGIDDGGNTGADPGTSGTASSEAASDTVTITVTNVNDAPTDITLSDATVLYSEGSSNVVVGTLSTTDVDAGETFTYSLVAGTGDTDNAYFNINGSQLRANNPTAMADGTYTVRIQTSDGEATYSEAFTITVEDDIAPNAPSTPDMTAATDSGSSSTDNITNDTSPTFTGTGDADVTVTLYDTDGTTVVGSGTADGSGNWTITATALSEGAHSITAKAADAFDNTSSASGALAITIDTTAPTVSDANITISGATGTGGAFKVGDTVTATWDNTASGDNNAAISAVTIDFSQFGGGAAVAATNNGGLWSATFLITEDGGDTIDATNLNVSVTATDSAGNTATTADTSDATMDNDSPGTPAGTLTVDENSANGTAVGAVTVGGTDAITYSLTDNADGRFAIDAAGNVTVADSTLLDYESAAGHQITVRATDNAGNTTDAVLVVTIVNVNEKPTDIALSANTITENVTVGTGIKIGDLTVTDPDAAGNANVLTLEGTDAASFTIRNGTELYFIGDSPDFETQPLYSITVKSTDGDLVYSEAFTIQVTDTNDAPTGITLSAGTIAENVVVGTGVRIGNLTVIDPDAAGNANILTLEGPDAAAFEIRNGTELYFTGDSPDFETRPLYSITVKSTDGTLIYFEDINISVTDVKEAPIGIALSANTITENVAVGTGIKIGDLTITDPDASGNVNTLSLSGPDAAVFEIRNGTELYFIGDSPDFETRAGYSITVSSADGALVYSDDFTITVIDANDAPAITGAGTLAATEDTPAVYIASGTDADGDTLTYGLKTGAANGTVTVDGNAFTYTPNSNFNGTDSFIITVSDGNGGTAEKTVDVAVVAVNDAPVIISDGGGASAVLSIAEGTLAVSTVRATDADSDALAFFISGGADAALFAIDPATGVLTFISAPDFDRPGDTDADNIYIIDIMADDGQGGTDLQTITVTVEAVIPPEDEWSVLPDDDGDGVPEKVEEFVPGIGDAAQGDGNGDGVPDAEQSDVSSVPFRNTDHISQEPDAPQVFVTLVGGSVDGAPDTDSGNTVTLSNIEQLDAPADLPAGVEMPLGEISFEAATNTIGATESFSLFVDDSLLVNGYWKQNAAGEWVNLASAEYGGAIVVANGAIRLDFSITDGGQFDADGVANGVIVDPGAAAFVGSTWLDTVQDLYIAYYQRPADPAGLAFWIEQVQAADGNLSGIIDAFANSAESTRLYGEINITTIGSLIDSVYEALFGRTPDVAGKEYYLQAFTSGNFPDGRPATAGTIAYDIYCGAQNEDAQAIANKLDAAEKFTWLLDQDQDGLGQFLATYDANDEFTARQWLAQVASDSPTLTDVYDVLATEIANTGDLILIGVSASVSDIV